jgi:hypothetical protein
MILFLLLLLLVLAGLMWRQRYLRQQRQLTLRQLRRWIGDQTEVDPELQGWMNGLSVGEADVLLDLLDGYCASLNWELSWLFTPQIQKTPVLKQALEEGVITYACSLLASLQLVDDVHLYQSYVALTKKPTARKQFVLIQKLHKKLSERGVIITDETQRRWWRRQPTRNQRIAAVIGAFDQEPAMAMETLKALLTSEAEAEVQQVVNRLPLAMEAAT